MGSAHTPLRFTDQDDRTLSLLARVQRETGYIPTMGELTQLLQCPTTSAARQRLDELIISGEGTHLTPAEQQEMAEIAKRVLRNEAPDVQRHHDQYHRQRTCAGSRSHVRWASAEQGDISSASS